MGGAADLELTLVLGPPIPSWAFDLGFDGDFPGDVAEESMFFRFSSPEAA